MNRPEIFMRKAYDPTPTSSAGGILEVLPDGFGFLRTPEESFAPSAEDIYVSPSQIRRFNLKSGDSVNGAVRAPKENERYYALIMVKDVNGGDPEEGHGPVDFHKLRPVHPHRALDLSGGDEDLRPVELFSPIGLGSRGLVVSPPRGGVSTLITSLTSAITRNHGDTGVTVLLLDARPEDVSEFQESVECEIVSTTFDETHARHVQAAEMVVERAKRRVELGSNEVVVIDSLNRLLRAYNAVTPDSGRELPGGVDPAALQRVKRLFGAARSIDEGGSLTILAVVNSHTGSRMDQILLEEIQGVANVTLPLSKELTRARIFPAWDLNRMNTANADLLQGDDTHDSMERVRAALPEDPVEAVQLLRGAQERSDGTKGLCEELNARLA